MGEDYSGRPVRLICDRLGWPVTIFKGRPITNLIRYALHGRQRLWWWRLDRGGLLPMKDGKPVLPTPNYTMTGSPNV